MNKPTQEQILLDIFRNSQIVTVQLIQHKAWINSPRKVISDLRKKGYKIHSRRVTHLDQYGTVVHYNEYWLEENEHVNAEVRA